MPVPEHPASLDGTASSAQRCDSYNGVQKPFVVISATDIADLIHIARCLLLNTSSCTLQLTFGARCAETRSFGRDNLWSAINLLNRVPLGQDLETGPHSGYCALKSPPITILPVGWVSSPKRSVSGY